MPTIIPVLQHETARINFNEQKDTELLIGQLIKCAAIVISDGKGRFSVTHADNYTDHSFIEREVKALGGKCTVDIVMDKSVSEQSRKEILRRVGEKYVNSKGTREVRNTTSGYVLLRAPGVLKVPEEDSCQELFARDINARKHAELVAKIRQDHKKSQFTSDDHLDTGSLPMQMRIDVRFINCLFNLQDTPDLPVVVYDGKWTGNFEQLNSDASRALELRSKLDPSGQGEFLINTLTMFREVPPTKNELEMILQLPVVVPRYLKMKEQLEKDRVKLASGSGSEKNQHISTTSYVPPVVASTGAASSASSSARATPQTPTAVSSVPAPAEEPAVVRPKQQ